MSGMIPRAVWGQKQMTQKDPSLEPDETPQETCCYSCVLDGHEIPPRTIVLVGGYSLCLPHARVGIPNVR